MSGTGNTTIPTEPESRSSLASSEGLVLALFLAWSAHQPERVGEAALFDPRAPGPSVAGREVPGGPARVHFLQILPGETIDGGPLTGENISQEQLEIDVVGEALRIRNVGRALVRVNGTDLPRWQAVIAPPGTAVEVHGNCVLLVGVSPLSLPAPHPRLLPLHAFGQADRMGFAGESWRMHRLRGDVVIAAMAARHVLVTGETGTGKELVAKGIHALSLRSREPFMTTNSSSFTQELAAYELFGNAKNVPNVGTPAREGYFGHARGGTLFLDEMGIVLDVVQAPLLRALEGSYNRVGDPVARPTECIVIVATNLGPDSIKHDVLYRLGVRVETPALRERREDIALLVQMFLLRYADGNAAFEKALVKSDGTGRRTVAVDPSLVVNLLRSPLRGNVRELANI
ncbi:MAG TPA: sigma 54-interacting transcriptional regulator, partial [Polyangiaceae bacterium]